MKSILDNIIIKIEKKNIEVKASLKSLFSNPKKAKFTFLYHEAHSLEQFLLIAENFILSPYDKNAVLFIKNKLNQQLA
jgi:hypothetical protein